MNARRFSAASVTPELRDGSPETTGGVLRLLRGQRPVRGLVEKPNFFAFRL